MGRRKAQDPITAFVASLSTAPENTVRTYSRVLKAFAGWVSTSATSTVQTARVSELRRYVQAERARGLRPSSIALTITTLRVFFEFLVAQGMRAENPALEIKLPTVRRPRRRPCLQPTQVTALLDAFDDQSALGLRDRCIVELLYSGVRASELRLIRVSDARSAIASSGDARLYFASARGRPRSVRLGPRARTAVSSYLTSGRPELGRANRGRELVISRTGAPIDRRDVWRIVRRGFKEAGLPPASPSVLQRSFALHAVELGETLQSVRASLGHAEVHTTRKFLGESAERVSRARRERRREAAAEALAERAARRDARALLANERRRAREARKAERAARAAERASRLSRERDTEGQSTPDAADQTRGRGEYLEKVRRELHRRSARRNKPGALKKLTAIMRASRREREREQKISVARPTSLERLERHRDSCVSCWNHANGNGGEMCRFGSRLQAELGDSE